MNRTGYIIMGVFSILLLTVTLVVFRVSGSEEYVYVEGCTPYNVDIEKTDDENSVIISWESKERCTGYILYGTEMRELTLVGVDLVNDTRTKIHTVVLRDLLTTRRYFFSIVSDDITYGKNGLPIQFTIDSL